MPVARKLKQRLAQEFQQKHHGESGAQVSRAEQSEGLPRSSGSKDSPKPLTDLHVAISAPQPSLPLLEKVGSVVLQTTDKNDKQIALENSRPEQQPHSKHIRPATVASKPSYPTTDNQLVPVLKRQKSDKTQNSERKAPTVLLTPVDILRTPSDPRPHPLGSVPASSCTSYSELWTAIKKVCGDSFTRSNSRLCYQDSDNDWISLLPETPFKIFSGSVKRLLVIPMGVS